MSDATLPYGKTLDRLECACRELDGWRGGVEMMLCGVTLFTRQFGKLLSRAGWLAGWLLVCKPLVALCNAAPCVVYVCISVLLQRIRYADALLCISIGEELV